MKKSQHKQHRPNNTLKNPNQKRTKHSNSRKQARIDESNDGNQNKIDDILRIGIGKPGERRIRV
jgi:hypothetical protein